MRRILIGWCALLLLICAVGVQAQNREDDIPYVTFAVTGGRPDNYHYTIRDRPEDFSRLYTAINTVIPVINQLTGETWSAQIALVMMGTSGVGRTVLARIEDPYTAWVTRRETRQIFDPLVCHVRIFNEWASDPQFETFMARQLFHCWQMENGSVDFGDFTVRSKFFWLQGGAEWVAYRAFPAQFPQPYHTAFDPRVDVTQARYDAFYFWEFMAGSNGLGDDQRVIAQLDALSQDAESFPLVYDYEPTDLFHNWALTLYNRALPMPPLIDLSGATLPAGNGGNLGTSMQRFSADFKNLFGFQVEDGNIAYLTLSGMEDGNYAASLQVAGGLQRLSDDAPLEFCPQDSGNMIILSRGAGAPGSAPMLQLEWGQNPSPNACKPKPEESTTNAENCVVGTWVVDSYPVSVQTAAFASVDTSGFVYTFGADGSLSVVYGIVANGEGMIVTANVPYEGSYAVTGGEGGTYAVNNFTLTIQPGGSYMANAGSTTTNMTTPYYQTSSDFSPWSPNGELQCEGDTMTWNARDGTGQFVLSRIA